MSEKQKSDRKMSTKRKIGMQKRLKRKKKTAKMSTKKMTANLKVYKCEKKILFSVELLIFCYQVFV